MNLPNKLTLFRIILVPVMVIVSFFNIPGSFLGISTTMWIMELIFIVASITDKLDGYLARKNNQVTDFGKVMDAIADKILVNGILIIMACNGMLPVVVPVIIILRDTAVDSIKMVAGSKNGKAVGASIWGKMKTVCMMTGLSFMFFSNLPFELFGFSLGYYLVIIACILSIYSGIQYFISNKNVLLKNI